MCVNQISVCWAWTSSKLSDPDWHSLNSNPASAPSKLLVLGRQPLCALVSRSIAVGSRSRSTSVAEPRAWHSGTRELALALRGERAGDHQGPGPARLLSLLCWENGLPASGVGPPWPGRQGLHLGTGSGPETSLAGLTWSAAGAECFGGWRWVDSCAPRPSGSCSEDTGAGLGCSSSWLDGKGLCAVEVSPCSRHPLSLPLYISSRAGIQSLFFLQLATVYLLGNFL